MINLTDLTEAITHAKFLISICDSDELSWDDKYDLILRNEGGLETLLEYGYDTEVHYPDTSYKDDVLAFRTALCEDLVKWNTIRKIQKESRK